MPESPEISYRSVERADAEAIMEIYNREVLGSRITLDLVPRSHSEQVAWIDEHSGAYAAIVAVKEGVVIGFASISPYRIRPGYSTTVEDSIYIDPDHRGMGVGKALLSRIVDTAAKHGFHACMARVAAGHEASLALHHSVGFFKVGVEQEVGRKYGQWIDMVLLERILNS